MSGTTDGLSPVMAVSRHVEKAVALDRRSKCLERSGWHKDLLRPTRTGGKNDDDAVCREATDIASDRWVLENRGEYPVRWGHEWLGRDR
jgi:hypothetical protein